MKRSLCFAVIGLAVLVCLPAQAKVLVYEPFDYPDAPLNGNGGALGTTGTWTTNDTGEPQGWWCHPEGELTGQGDDLGPGGNALNLFNGTVDNLPTSGGFAGPAGPTDQSTPGTWGTRDQTGNLDANIGLDPSVTATFQSGTTTWFSYVGAHADNRNQGSPTFMLCTDPTTNGSRGLNLQNSGNGIGGVGGPPRYNLFDVYPHYFSGGVHHQTPGGYLGGVLGGHDGIVTAFCSTATCDGVLGDDATREWVVRDGDGFMGVPNIVVGKIEWDADTGGEDVVSVVSFLETDELTEAAFDAIIADKPLLSSRNWPGNKPNLDQSQFDTINISSLKFFIDEIRIATTFEDVVGGSPSKAKDPQPEANGVDVPRDLVLAWTPGEYADTHDVYLGTVFDDVNDASRNDPRGVLVRQRQSESTYDPGRLAFGTTYYWRVDEVNPPPDNTIFKGNVWSFTTEPYAYPIENITATASSSNSANEGPENTINGSGLDADDLHSTASTAMWLSSSSGPQPTWIQYEFDRAHKLHEMWVWNYNVQFEHIIGFGLKDVTVQYSTNGVEWKALSDVQFAWGPGAAGYAHDTIVDFGGVVAKYVKITAKSNWGGRAEYGLSEVRFFYIPVWAREPNPDSGATGVGVDNATVSWRASREAASHKVYFSTSRKAVADETVSPVSIPANGSYGSYNVGALDLGRTYYWKVNEVNEAEIPTMWQGEVWNFRTDEFIAVDDFESYDDYDNRIFYSWRDGYGFTEPPPGYPGNGTGSTVGNAQPPYAEQSIVHGGRQSMPLTYDNTGTAGKARYSETERTFATSQDWTKAGIKALTLWFHGETGNAAEQLYVAVEDSLGQVRVATHPNPEALQRATWQQWNIARQQLGGVNLASVKKLYIGVGNRNNPQAGGSGKLYSDDIRLYPARCLPNVIQPGADLNDDCVVDYLDIQILANEWLGTGYEITPVNPGSAGLVAHWAFDDGAGTTAQDSSGNNNHGTVMGGAQWVAGQVGGALQFDETDNYVAIQDLHYQGNDYAAVSVCAWIRTDSGADQYVASFDRNEYWRLEINGSGAGPGQVGWDVMTNTGQVDYGSDARVDDGQWHHVVGVFDNGTLTIYIDGSAEPSATGGPTFGTGNTRFGFVGANSEATVFDGARGSGNPVQQIDDVHLYSRALSQAEIASLAGHTSPFSEPFDMYQDGTVDFKDFAELAVWWLDEQLWP